MNDKTKQALELAMGALEEISSQYMSLPKNGCMALAAIKEALAEQPAQQPFNHTAAANAALREAQNRSYQIAMAAQQHEPVFKFQMQLKPGWGSQYPTPCVIGDPDLRSLFSKIGDVVTFYTSPPASKPLSGYINAAGINANDSPHIVVEKLERAIEAANGIMENRNEQRTHHPNGTRSWTVCP